MASHRDNLFHKVSEFIKRQAMLDDASGVVVGISGGADSVTLLDVLIRLRQSLKGTNQGREVKLHLAHLNHLLRGKESDADGEFVGRLAEHFAVNLTTDSVDVRTIARATGKGIEETARELRYRFFVNLANESGCNRIATGHTMNDQAETFVMRLARGAGLRGLAAMRPVVSAHRFDHAEIESNRTKIQGANCPPNDEVEILPSALQPFNPSPLLIRPLLCVTRDQVEAYCLERGLDFRTDASNESLSYTRNRVRHETLKALRSINPKVVERIAQTAEIIASEQDALEEAAQVFLEQAKVPAKSWQGDDQEVRKQQAYSIAALRNHSTGLRRRILIAAIRQIREKNREREKPTSEITFVHIAAIEKLMEKSSSGQRIHLPDGLEVWREFDALVLVCAGERQSAAPQTDAEAGGQPANLKAASSSAKEFSGAYLISKDQPVIEVARLRISLSRGQPGSALTEILDQARLQKALCGRDWQTGVLDDALVPEKLVVRPRKKGETVWVSGQRKIIKLKKLMIAHKIAPSRRTSWPIVVTLDGEYVWSPGLPPAVKFAAHDKTQSLAILRASDV